MSAKNTLHTLLDKTTWTTATLGEHLITIKGKKPKRLLQEPIAGALPYATADYFRTCKASYFVPTDELGSCVRIQKGNLIMIWDGNAGEVFIGKEDSILASTMALLSFKEPCLKTEFCYFFLQTSFNKLNQFATGAVIPHVSKSVLTNLQLPLPPPKNSRN